MAYNFRYQKGIDNEPSGLDMTDIPGLRSNPKYGSDAMLDDSRNISPPKYNTGANAEMTTFDMIRSNEEKVRNQIKYQNNSGIIGPYLKFDKTTPASKSPKMSLGVSAYNMHFSPGKQRANSKINLNNSYSSISNRSCGANGLRHIANGEAMYRRSPIGNSIDFSTSKGPNVKYDRNINLSDKFRIKKNLTTNANRILTKQVSYANSTERKDPNKIDDLRREAKQFLNQNSSPKGGSGNVPFKTMNSSYNQENTNADNEGRPMISKPAIYDAAGAFNSSSLKRSMGISPKDNVNFVPSVSAPMDNNVRKINQNTSMPNLNDPGYHRNKNLNNYGFDVLTGVRKDSPYRML